MNVITSNFHKATFPALFFLSILSGGGQPSFQNLSFDNTTLSVTRINPSGPYYATNATIPGWDWSPHETFGFGDPNTTVAYGGRALDSSAVSLHRRDYYAISNYSILLQGGSSFYPQQYGGASIFQTGSIPATARSLTYFGDTLEVSFNGQSLSSILLDSTPTSNKWIVDVSPYSGQSGELRFAVPWQAMSRLDEVQFSPNVVPEPSALALGALGIVLVCAKLRCTLRQHPTAGQQSVSHLPAKGYER